MSDIKKSNGNVIQIVAPATLTSGVPYLSGKLFFIPETDAVSGADCAVAVKGEHRLPKVGGGGITFARGDKVYWNQSSLKATATATDVLIGTCTVAAGDSATTVDTLLAGQAIDVVDADAIAGAASGTYAGDFTRVTSTTIAVKKHNMAATTAPAITDDSASDYAVGSRWIDTTNDRAYVCVDASAGAAVWLPAGVPMKSGTITIASGGSTGTASPGAAYNGMPVLVTIKAPAGAYAAADFYLKAVVAAGTLTVTVTALDGSAQNASSNIDVYYLIVGQV